MLFFGHIAVSLLIANAADGDEAAAIAGNLLPDVVDKSGRWLLHVMPSARWLAHGLPCFAAVALSSSFVLDRRRWRSFVLGYAGHLVCDLWAGGRVPLLAPFERPRPRRPGRARGALVVYLLPEALGLPYTLWRLRARGRAVAAVSQDDSDRPKQASSTRR